MGAADVSIVLPTFNGAKYVGKAIDSCLNQSYTSFELVVVDDASTDATPVMLARYASADPRIKIITHGTNMGLPAALNTGHESAAGMYMSWTSDDNILKQNFLMDLVCFLEDNPACDYVYSDFDVIDADGNIIDHVKVDAPEAWIRPGARNASFLYRRRLYERTGRYDSNMTLGEDWDYWLRAYKQHRFAPLNTSLYQYRVHMGALSKTRQAQQFLAAERLWRAHVDDLKCINKRNRAEIWMFLAYAKLRRGELGPGAVDALKSLVIDPVVLVTKVAAAARKTVRRRRGE